MDLTGDVKLLFILLKLTGLWPPNLEYRRDSPYTFFTLVCFIIFSVGFNLPQIIKLFLIYDDLETFTASIFILCNIILASTKFCIFIKNISIIKDLFKRLESDAYQPRTEEQRAMLHKTSRPWKILWGVFLGTAVLTQVTALNFALAVRALPFLAWYPFDTTKSPMYEVTVVEQMSSLAHLATVNTTFDGMAGALMMLLTGQCNLLSDNLRNLAQFQFHTEAGKNGEQSGSAAEVDLNKGLIKCIQHHKEILSFAKSANEFFNVVVLLQLMTSTVAICMTMFKLSLATPLSAEFTYMIVYMFCIFSQILLYCWLGNEAMLASEQIPYAAFENTAIEAPIEFKKNLIIFIMCSQKPIKLYALNFFVLSVQTFTSILKSSWSYFALLREVNN